MLTTTKPYFPRKDIFEILKSIRKVLEGKEMLTMGNNVKLFEKRFAKYIGTKYAITTNSCTSALETSLRAIEVKGKEVLVPPQTFIATGNAVVNTGGIPIFTEIAEDHNISVESMKEKTTNKTKAIIVVHYGGLISKNIFEIKKYCKKKEIVLIEDCAHAHGASKKGIKAGNIGDIGCFSFYATKIITCGEGGMITTNNNRLYKKMASIRNRGLDLNANREIFINVGSNYRMTEISAILGLSQLKNLKDFLKHRRKLAKKYDMELKDLEKEGLIETINVPKETQHSYWKYLVKLNPWFDREKVYDALLKKNIRIDWAYDPPLHLQPVFKRLYGTKKGMLPFSEKEMGRHICLPMHMKVTLANAQHVINSLREVLLELKK